MTDAGDDTDGDTLEELAEYLRLNPDATTPEVLGATHTDPSVWGDIVNDALATAEPHLALETPDTGAPEGDSRDANPTPDAGATHSGRRFYPDWIQARDWWIDWVLAHPYDDDGEVDWNATPTKQPVAPYWNGTADTVRWNFDLPEDEHPCTDFATADRWEGWGVGDEVPAPDRVVSDEIGTGIIIPRDQSDHATVTLLDWDDVRDPETGEIHPVAAGALEAVDAYAEVSQSGEGIHQFVFGEIPGGLRKFIRHVDDQPFVGDDRPQIEMYQSGRVCAMTGEHVAGSGEDVAGAQDLIDELCWRFGTASNNAEGVPTDPFATERDDAGSAEATTSGTSAVGETDVPDHEEVADQMREATAYDGPAPADWDVPEDRSVEYHGVLLARERSDQLAGVANWELIGYAAALGYRDGLSKDQVKEDLRDHPTPGYGYDDSRAEKEVRSVYGKAENGGYAPPSTDRLVERGILPEVLTEGEHTAVLPTAIRDLTTAASGWDWQHAGRTGPDTLTIASARERTADAIADAYERGDRVLVEALPTMGKSYGAVKAAADTGEPVTIVTGRGRKEQYDQFKQWCDEHGVSCKELPAFTEDCPTAAGDHGEEWQDTVMDWYGRGATPQQIHNRAEYHLSEPLPCQVAEDGTRIECAHRHAWNFNPDDYDVLLGHYTHAHTQQATEGRTVVFDEFPGAYETGLVGMKSALSYWLESTEGVPFEDYTDLIENRDDQQRRGEALLWFEDQGVEPDEGHVFEDATAHADAPLAVYTLLAAEGLGNGIERADLGDGGTGVFNRQTTEVSVLRPPALEYASGVVALDGTPTKRMWELALGERLNHRPVLQDGERAEYVRDALNLNLVRTSEHIKPYNSADHVNTDQDAALLEAIGEKHGEKPALITTTTAKGSENTTGEYEKAGILDLDENGDVVGGLATAAKHYGNVLGSNEFDDTRLGAVIGSNHYGDHYIKKWGAYAGEAVDRGDEKGADLSYSGFGDDVLQHMREHDTLQAAMRFGRDGNGAVVYVHTDTLPEWVPVAGEGRVVSTWSDGMRDVVSALEDLTTATTADVVAHPAVDLSRQQVFDHLENLRERGVLQRQQDPEDGRRVVWRDDGLHRLGEHGEVELEPVDLEDLDDDEVRQLARSSIYTWEFTNLTTKVDATEAEAEHGIAKAPKDGKMYEPSRGRWWTA